MGLASVLLCPSGDFLAMSIIIVSHGDRRCFGSYTRLALLPGLGVSGALARTPAFPLKTKPRLSASASQLPMGTGAKGISFLGLAVLTYPGFLALFTFLFLSADLGGTFEFPVLRASWSP